MPTLTEDDIYRTSTQYRLWSFTKASLESLRSTTNATAADGVRVAIKKRRPEHAKADQDDKSSAEVDCLTVEEEQRLVGYYCLKAMQFADFAGLPTNVKATAVQFMKRFYLTNSPMTYHPKEIMLTALFLSTKTENNYISLAKFASKFEKTTQDDVIAPEFLLTQGLRFTFDVRHPYRGLEGGYMELLALAKGNGTSSSDDSDLSVKLQKMMMQTEPAKSEGETQGSVQQTIQRLEKSKSMAQDILKTSALLTDAYFLYTPSQIWLSALFLADESLVCFYLDAKFPTPSPLKPKLISTIQSCVELLGSSPSAKPKEAEVSQLRKIDKKLYMCRNPEKIDLIGINKAQKREGSENGLDEKVIKKRKMEREQQEKEAEDVFGPAIAAKR
ncbi:hypothetical protein ACLMJK_009339 [Lecanora helva]